MDKVSNSGASVLQTLKGIMNYITLQKGGVAGVVGSGSAGPENVCISKMIHGVFLCNLLLKI